MNPDGDRRSRRRRAGVREDAGVRQTGDGGSSRCRFRTRGGRTHVSSIRTRSARDRRSRTDVDGSLGLEATEAQARAPARSAAERAEGGVVQDRVAVVLVGDLLEGLIEQVQGAAAIVAVEGDGTLALAADFLGGELDRQGVDRAALKRAWALACRSSSVRGTTAVASRTAASASVTAGRQSPGRMRASPRPPRASLWLASSRSDSSKSGRASLGASAKW